MYRHWKYTSRSKASLWGVVFDAFFDAKSPNDEVITGKIYTQDLGNNMNSTDCIWSIS